MNLLKDLDGKTLAVIVLGLDLHMSQSNMIDVPTEILKALRESLAAQIDRDLVACYEEMLIHGESVCDLNHKGDLL